MGHVMFYFQECGVIRRNLELEIWFCKVRSFGSETTKKFPWTILEELPVPRNTAASKIINGVISLL